jgi:hypothetical protein
VGAGVDLITAADLRYCTADAAFCVKVSTLHSFNSCVVSPGRALWGVSMLLECTEALQNPSGCSYMCLWCQGQMRAVGHPRVTRELVDTTQHAASSYKLPY